MVCTPGLTLVLPFLQGYATSQVGGHWLLTAGSESDPWADHVGSMIDKVVPT